jgi:hypothetical protein
MLHPLRIDGEVRVEIIKSGDTYSHNSPNISDRLDTYTEFSSNTGGIDNFRLKSNLINDCLNKL